MGSDGTARLTGKTVLVTGGAGLIGSAFCRAIATAGGTPVIADIDTDRATQLAGAIRQESGADAPVLAMNILSESSVEESLDAMLARYGRLDGLVNNAYPRNRNYGRRIEDVALADFNENLSMHLGGYFVTLQKFAARAAVQGGKGASVINMGSIYGVIAPKFEVYDGTSMTMPVEYAAIKSGVSHLTRYFAKYYRKSGLRVNTLSPGGVLDGQAESFVAAYNSHCGTLGMLDVNELCGTLIYLLSDDSRGVTGQNITVDDGFSL